MKCLKENSPELGRESRHDALLSVRPDRIAKVPGQVLLMLTASRLFRATSPNAPTTEIFRKEGYDKAKILRKGELR